MREQAQFQETQSVSRVRNQMIRWLILVLTLLVVSLACNTIQSLGNPSDQPSQLQTNSTPITCADDSCLNVCLGRIHQELEAHPFDEVGGDYTGTEANFHLVVYQVDGDQITNPYMPWVPSEYRTYQQDTDSHQRVWAFFVSLVPPEQRKWIDEYVVFTDDSFNKLAWVGQIEFDDNSRWQLGVDLLDSTDPIMLVTTLTHELGHLITLNSDQIIRQKDTGYTPYQNPTFCPQFLSEFGCSTTGSYINSFYQSFWVDTYNDWLETVYDIDTSTSEDYYATVMQFYENHPGAFVTQYAATNIREDMAETFKYFILFPKPTGDRTIDKKVLFYYDYPELITLRKKMIENLCSYVQ